VLIREICGNFLISILNAVNFSNLFRVLNGIINISLADKKVYQK